MMDGSNNNNNNNIERYANQVGEIVKVGMCTLMAAAANEHFQTVKYLIEQGS